MGVAKVSERTGLLPSDVHRLLKSGPRAVGSGRGGALLHAPPGRFLSSHGQPLFDPREFEVIFVEQVHSPGEVQIRLRIRAKVAPHPTGAGKVLAAAMDRGVPRQLMRQNGMARRTRHTITDMAKLERELDCVADDGYAMDREEGLLGASCIAAHVRNHSGSVVAALSLSTMASRLNAPLEPKLIAQVNSTAAKISAALGYHAAAIAERNGGS